MDALLITAYAQITRERMEHERQYVTDLKDLARQEAEIAVMMAAVAAGKPDPLVGAGYATHRELMDYFKVTSPQTIRNWCLDHGFPAPLYGFAQDRQGKRSEMRWLKSEVRAWQMAGHQPKR